MKTVQILKKTAGILALVLLLMSCDNTLPPFALTKGITKNPKNNSTSEGNNNTSTNNGNSTNNNNSQNGTDTPQVPGKPDLVAVSLEPSDGMPVKGKWEVWEAETYENGVIATIKNEGTADITTLFKVGVYARYNDPDVYRGNSSLYYGMRIGVADVTDLKAGEAKKIPITLDNIPNNTNIGKNNYIGLYVDCEGNITESDEDNNKGGYNKAFKEYQRDDKTLHFLEIHENRPDIVALSFDPPTTLYKGETGYASVTIKNTGHRDALNLFKVGVSARYDSIIYGGYWQIGVVEVTGLRAGETKELTIPVLLNYNGRYNQYWYIGVGVDCDGNITEMERERNGEGNYNYGGYNGNTGSYEPGDLLKTIYYSE